MAKKVTPNKYEIDGDVAYILLNRDMKAKVDTKFLEELLSVGSWTAMVVSKTSGYYVFNNKTKKYLHREVLRLDGQELKEHTDHKNHDTLDNTLSNLRACTRSENFRNKKLYANSKTGLRGVSPKYKGYQAMLTYNKNNIYLGYYSNKEDASAAFDLASILLLGNEANSNMVGNYLELSNVLDIIDKINDFKAVC